MLRRGCGSSRRRCGRAVPLRSPGWRSRWLGRGGRVGRWSLWRRDRTCTYPGCTAPAGWARAHHVRHWVDGGATDLDNAALLCQRHHTFVHDRRLWATVRHLPDELGRYVVWDLDPGSYDRQLEWLARQRPE